ncbi:MAG: transketolase [Oscillospiraceae bacterium]|nr:transketolase [Oscillospiraceae bacterium]
MLTLNEIAASRRLDVLEMVYRAKSGHIGGSMSCMDILVNLYYYVMDRDTDYFILSKGHCAEALYSVLADLNYIPKEELETFTRFGTRLAEHPTKKVPGVVTATGALGHGLSVGAGIALGLKRDKKGGSVYILMGDGEMAEGSIWEAIMSAAKYKLDNLIAIVDRNRLQISGGTENVMPMDGLSARFQAFGWNVVECDGHGDMTAVLKARRKDKPSAVIANTIKGRGSSVMENNAEWHHLIPSAEQYIQIKNDLGG